MKPDLRQNTPTRSSRQWMKNAAAEGGIAGSPASRF